VESAPQCPSTANRVRSLFLVVFESFGTNVDFGHSDPDSGCRLHGQGRGQLQKQNGEKTMRIWIEHDPVALALLLVGLATVELLAFII
jgi:hypothetical protein